MNTRPSTRRTHTGDAPRARLSPTTRPLRFLLLVARLSLLYRLCASSVLLAPVPGAASVSASVAVRPPPRPFILLARPRLSSRAAVRFHPLTGRRGCVREYEASHARATLSRRRPLAPSFGPLSVHSCRASQPGCLCLPPTTFAPTRFRRSRDFPLPPSRGRSDVATPGDQRSLFPNTRSGNSRLRTPSNFAGSRERKERAGDRGCALSPATSGSLRVRSSGTVCYRFLHD